MFAAAPSLPPRCKECPRRHTIDPAAIGKLGQFILELTKRPDIIRVRITARFRYGSAGLSRTERNEMAIFQSGVSPPLRGRRGGRPIIMIHGFTITACLDPTTRGTRAFRLSRHCTRSARTWGLNAGDGAVHCGRPRNDMRELLDHLDRNPVALCGLSLGGMIALEMAIEQPNRVASVVVANSRSSFSDPEMIALVEAGLPLPSRTVR